MAFPKHGRHERRTPSSYVILTGAVFVGFFLIAVWVYSSPAAVLQDATEKSSMQISNSERTRTETFEDTPVTSTESGGDYEVKESETQKVVEDNDEKLQESFVEPRKQEEKIPIDDDSAVVEKETLKEDGILKDTSGEKTDLKEDAILKDTSDEKTDVKEDAVLKDTSDEKTDIKEDAVLKDTSDEKTDVKEDAILKDTSDEKTDIKEDAFLKDTSDEKTDIKEDAILKDTSDEKTDVKEDAILKDTSDEDGYKENDIKEEIKSTVPKDGKVLAESTEKAGSEERKSRKQETDDLPPMDTSESQSSSDSKDAYSSWKSQDKESRQEKDVIKNSAADESTTQVLTETPVREGTESAIPTEEEKKIEEKQKKATTPIVIEEEVTKKPVEKYRWKLCEWKGAQDYIPCLDNKKWLATHHARKHFEHRERHCPSDEELPKCLVPLPPGYKPHIQWPDSRHEIWYDNVPHTGLVQYKKDQNWVKKSGEKLIFSGGGTQFRHGAGHYIDWVQKIYPEIGWGKHTRVLLDVGCGVASFGGYLYDRDVLAMSFAPKDEHEAQVQLALERGIPAFSSVMGTQRLVFPSNSFDVVHCARCRVPWHFDGGMLLLELNRVLRPGGHFVWSATPVYQELEEDKQIWKETIAVIESMGWKMKAKETDEETQIGAAIFQKPTSNEAYESRTVDKPEICPAENNPDAAWYVKMTACIHKVPNTKRCKWPEEWPARAKAVPQWLNDKETGLYGKPAPEDFNLDTKHWDRVVKRTYKEGLGIDWKTIRNVMDMKAGYGGFAAALLSQKVWVLNIVPTSEPDTLPIIYDRGLLGMYHDWCEPHSTYPRTYDLLHADHLISSVKSKKCSIVNLVMEMDRILRPDGWVIFRDEKSNLAEVEEIVKSLRWDVKLTFSKQKEELLVVQKKFWRPDHSS